MVPTLWPGSTIVVLATGPSLTQADVDFVRDRARVICINDAHRLAPWADVLYAADAKWWAFYEGVPAFGGLKFSVQADAARWPGVQVLRNTGETGLETDPTGLRMGRNSTYQGVNLAVHLGAARVLLLGADMGPRADGREHFFGDHPRAIAGRSPYHTFIERFRTMVDPLRALGVTVLNCSRTTALDAFPCVSLEEALA